MEAKVFILQVSVRFILDRFTILMVQYISFLFQDFEHSNEYLEAILVDCWRFPSLILLYCFLTQYKDLGQMVFVVYLVFLSKVCTRLTC